MSKLLVKAAGMSTCGRRVFTALEETGTPYEFKLDYAGGEHKTAEYKEKYHPFGLMPVLVDGDFALFESRAIIRYIGNVYDKSGTLYPSDPKTRALVDQWIDVSANSYSPIELLVKETFFKPNFFKIQPDAAVVTEQEAKAKDVFSVLDKHFAKGSQFFVGNNVTVADIAFAPYTEYLLTVPQYANILDAYPNLKAWWTRFSSRPSWQKVKTLQ
eukprot:TRINITY_DN1923_c0_g1_i1.p1 TRINITY_DN1923_c0_g1~~TRINITY_DN1923_c0_g1_i1.p1  ORF type:complete len:214 (+),score=56.40 TRINITY_DN1923_c0_g1_i1:181-822(+)